MANLRRYVPSLPGLYASLRLRSREFLRENTLHGFPYFVNPRRPMWERIAWFVCTLASIGAVIGIIITIMGTFWKDPILVGLDTESADSLVMLSPRVTLCQREPDFNFGPQHLDSDYYDSLYRWSWKPIENEPRFDARGENYSDIFYRAASDCQDLYQDCKYSGLAVPCDEIFRKTLTSRGVCCSVFGTEITRDTRPWGLAFNTNKAYPISVDLTENDAPPPARDSPSWYQLSKGATIRISLQIAYATEGMESVSLNRRECFLPSEAHSYNDCVRQCRRNLVVEMCGCVPWFLVSSHGHQRECAARDYNCLLEKRQIVVKHECECYLPCNHTAYQFEQVEDRADGTVELHMADWPSVIYKTDVRFGWLDLLVSFGGIAGLFIGYSLLTTVELTYYLFLRSYCGFVLDQPAKIIETRVPPTTSSKPKARRIKVIRLDDYDYRDYFD